MSEGQPAETRPRRIYVMWGVAALTVAGQVLACWLLIARVISLPQWYTVVQVVILLLSACISAGARWFRAKWAGIALAVLLFWLGPVIIETRLCMYDPFFGGFGLGVHLLTGWAFGLGYCLFFYWLAGLGRQQACGEEDK